MLTKFDFIRKQKDFTGKTKEYGNLFSPLSSARRVVLHIMTDSFSLAGSITPAGLRLNRKLGRLLPLKCSSMQRHWVLQRGNNSLLWPAAKMRSFTSHSQTFPR